MEQEPKEKAAEELKEVKKELKKEKKHEKKSDREIIAELTDTLQRLQAEFENYKKRVDREKAVDADAYHLSRMSANAYRIHVWDVEISDSIGNLLENDHLEIFDFFLPALFKWIIPLTYALSMSEKASLRAFFAESRSFFATRSETFLVRVFIPDLKVTLCSLFLSFVFTLLIADFSLGIYSPLLPFSPSPIRSLLCSPVV